jgi:hypothetical protein
MPRLDSDERSPKYKIGQAVRHRNRLYRVVTMLPEANGRGIQYRIKGDLDGGELIVVEKDLTKAYTSP